ncbi:MAG: hypothetical protein AAFV07_13615 [Bacteroidota bacterium]
MNRQQFLPFIVVLVGLAACREPQVTPNTYEVPSIVQPYIDQFELEASKRGQDIQIDNLIVDFGGELTDNTGNTAAGQCRPAFSGEPTPHITLDTTSANWRNNDFSREMLVFHELGHCILDRLQHKDDLLPNGNFSSIMRTVGYQLYGDNTLFKREYYLDELFNPNTGVPEWALNFPPYELTLNTNGVFIENFDNNSRGWNVGTSDESSSQINGGNLNFASKVDGKAFFVDRPVTGLDTEGDFQIEASIRIVSGENAVLMQWAGSGPSDFTYMGFTSDSIAFVGNWETGTALNKPVVVFNPNGFNKLTVRKIGDDYHLYINEQYFDILAFEAPKGNRIAFYVGPNTEMQVDYIYINQLVP